jgi:hypothetical protein
MQRVSIALAAFRSARCTIVYNAVEHSVSGSLMEVLYSGPLGAAGPVLRQTAQ